MSQEQNNIIANQNRQDRLELLGAQRIYYGRAKRLQAFFLVLALALPLVATIWGADYPKLRPWLSLAGVALLLVDIALATKLQRNWVKTGARIQEQFDTDVFELPWNHFVVGSKVAPETIREVTHKPMEDTERAGLAGWYAACVGALPLPLARLVCQRTNISYDMRVREAYATGLLVVAGLLFAFVLCRGMHEGMPMPDLVLAVLVPFVPLAAYVLREHRKQSDTVESLTTLRSEVDKLWAKALNAPTAAELKQDARNLQDAIYRNRTTNPLVYDWVYWFVRKRNEDVANHAAQALVDEAQRSIDKDKK